MQPERIQELFQERRGIVRVTMHRCSGREISVDLPVRRDIDEEGRRYRNGVLDNTDSEFLMDVAGGAKEFRCGLTLNHTRTRPGDRVRFEIVADGAVIGGRDVGFEDGEVEFRCDLGGGREFTVRSRSLSDRPQVAFYWTCPEVVTTAGETLPLIAECHETLLPDFNYDGVPFVTRAWRENTIELDDGNFIREFVSGDGRLKLEIEVRFYPEFNAVEYRPVLENISSQPTGIIDNFRSLAWRKPCEFMPHYGHGGEYRGVRIRRNYGTKSNFMDFVAQPVTLNANVVYPRQFSTRTEMVADEGRSSATWLPFWGVDMAPGKGVLVGFGWSGAWRADFALERGAFAMSAGMLRTHFRMEPGERFIQPSVLLMWRENESIETAQNRFRRLLIEHFAPRDGSGLVHSNQISLPVFGGIKTASHLQYIDLFARFGYPHDAYGIDAGWYGYGENRDVFSGTWAQEVGNWRVNPAHPDGLAPIGQAAQEQGKTVWIWFEPERARRGTDIVREHPEWYVDTGEDDLLLDLGNPEAWRWLTGMTIAFFEQNHIDQLHQDFNFNILPHWSKLDTPERIGVGEIKYIAGLYAYWDALRAHDPEFRIDHCASAGRRIDIESLRRGYVIWRSDAQCWADNDIVQNQIQNYYLNSWYPFHAGGAWIDPAKFDEYDFFSSVSNGVCDCTFIYKHEPPLPEEFDYARHAALLHEAVRIRPYFLGNYYQLSNAPEELENWCAYQFHDRDRGMVMIFRRPESPLADEVFRLREIDPEAEYEVEIYGVAEKSRCSGRELRTYSLSLPPRGFRLVYYRRVR